MNGPVRIGVGPIVEVAVIAAPRLRITPPIVPVAVPVLVVDDNVAAPAIAAPAAAGVPSPAAVHASANAKSLPPEGAITPTANDVDGGKAMQISATYTDKGGPAIKSLTGGNIVIINSPMLSLQANTKVSGITIGNFGGINYAMVSGDSGVIEFGNAKLNGVKGIEVSFGAQAPITKGYIIEVYEGNVNGKKIGEARIVNSKAGVNKKMFMLAGPINASGLGIRVRKADPGEGTPIAITAVRLF